jgi:hypothetical protein
LHEDRGEETHRARSGRLRPFRCVRLGKALHSPHAYPTSH